MRFDGKGVLITGGAGGMGRAALERFSAEGAKVYLVDRDEDGLRAASAQAGATVAGTSAIDVTRGADVQEAVSEARERLGSIDILLNNAGVYDIVPFLELTEQRWDDVVAIDLKGMFLVGQAVAREMGAGSAIVNTASIAALGASAAGPSAHYNAAKAGVVSLTKQMAIELAPLGIRVNAICPGIIDTPMLPPAERTPETVAGVPLGRLGRPQEMAALMAFLASDEASYITGEAVVIDGGLTVSQ